MGTGSIRLSAYIIIFEDTDCLKMPCLRVTIAGRQPSSDLLTGRGRGGKV